jgi:hypothetical protein
VGAKMSRSEKAVDSLAIVILVTGFMTGVIAKPTNKAPHAPALTIHSQAMQPRRNDEGHRPLEHV